ncbi:MAG: hypothetical protein DRI46_09395 [Chloroflexi bacterium]|nr:MAG: hypothetical protein DRI46_09395 [Chloroflexota bacterium]
MRDDSIFSLDANLNNLWVWCLSKASHTERSWDFIVKGKGKIYVNLLPGQFVCGRNSMAKAVNANPSTTWKRLKMLESHGFIDIKSDKKYSVVTIINWKSYKSLSVEKKQERGQDIDDERGQVQDTKKNVKNVKNVKNDKKQKAIFVLPSFVPDEQWAHFIEMRNKSKSMPTVHAKELLVKKLKSLKNDGEDIREVLNQSVLNNWKGVFACSIKNNGSKSKTKEINWKI